MEREEMGKDRPSAGERQPASFNVREDGLAGLPAEVTNAAVGPMVGISAIALNMALKYHDINTVQDGVLYQQYKMEGRNVRDLHLDMVFETAIQIEEHLIAANKRVAKMLVFAALDDEATDEQAPLERESGEGAPEDTTSR